MYKFVHFWYYIAGALVFFLLLTGALVAALVLVSRKLYLLTKVSMKEQTLARKGPSTLPPVPKPHNGGQVEDQEYAEPVTSGGSLRYIQPQIQVAKKQGSFYAKDSRDKTEVYLTPVEQGLSPALE